MPDVKVRSAARSDVPGILEIYRPCVEETAISFELDTPSEDEMASRVAAATERRPWLVAVADGAIAGYAYASAHRSREAYRYSVETSVYVASNSRRSGIAYVLYAELFEILEASGYQSAYAGITVPNSASVGFHSRFGFEPIGVFPRVGWKFGAWHDVMWMYRTIGSGQGEAG